MTPIFNRFILILFISSQTFAAEQPTSSSPGKEELNNKATIKAFFKCQGKGMSLKQLQKCASPVMSKKLSQQKQKRLSDWLAMRLELSKFKPCSKAKEKEAAYFPEGTPNYICAEIKAKGLKKDIVFFFDQEKTTQPRLYSFHY